MFKYQYQTIFTDLYIEINIKFANYSSQKIIFKLMKYLLLSFLKIIFNRHEF